MNDLPITNWIPYKLDKIDGRLKCRWINTFGEPFTEPFFNQTILKCWGMNSLHASISSVSDLTMMKEWSTSLDDIEPAAIIFHISRCGSTLVSQLLATSDQNIVLAEVPFFDNILRLPFKDQNFDHTTTAELLPAALKYYTQKKIRTTYPDKNIERRVIIKTDSWHVLFYRQLRQLFPSVPFILIYRKPNEVFRSLAKVPAMQAVPGLIEPQLFGFNPDEPVHDLDIYLANVLEKYLNTYLEIAGTDDRFLLLNYNEGPVPMVKKIASFAKIQLGEQDLLNMEERSRFHSKKPDEPFSEKASDHIPACLSRAMELYYALEGKKGEWGMVKGER